MKITQDELDAELARFEKEREETARKEDVRQRTALKEFLGKRRSAAQARYGQKSFGGSSKYKGVSRKGKKWRATIMCKGTAFHLGYYNDEKKAAKVYDEAAIKLFGKYAYLNRKDFPEDFKESNASI